MQVPKIFYNIVLGAIVLAGLFLLSTLLPIPGNFEVKVVKSGSMEPAIHTGSIIVMKPSASYEAGDVITYVKGSPSGMPTTHRIMAVHEEDGARSYTTKGDANDDEDMGQVAEHEVLGRVVATIPLVGYVIDAARKPLGFILLVGIPMAIIAIEAVATIWKEVALIRRQDKEEPPPENDIS